MFLVDLRIARHDLAAQMGDMRTWLDRHKVEASGFFIKGAMARLGFRVKDEAESFALRFAGRMISEPPIRRRWIIRRRLSRNALAAVTAEPVSDGSGVAPVQMEPPALSSPPGSTRGPWIARARSGNGELRRASV